MPRRKATKKKKQPNSSVPEPDPVQLVNQLLEDEEYARKLQAGEPSPEPDPVELVTQFVTDEAYAKYLQFNGANSVAGPSTKPDSVVGPPTEPDPVAVVEQFMADKDYAVFLQNQFNMELNEQTMANNAKSMPGVANFANIASTSWAHHGMGNETDDGEDFDNESDDDLNNTDLDDDDDDYQNQNNCGHLSANNRSAGAEENNDFSNDEIDDDNMSDESDLDDSFNYNDDDDDYWIPDGLTDDLINEIPTRIFDDKPPPKRRKKKKKEERRTITECYICFGDFVNGDCLTVLPCLHEYHKSCLNPWLKKEASCPTCRKEVQVERKKNKRNVRKKYKY